MEGLTMRHNRLIAAAAGVAFASTALVGCSSDDLDKVAEDAKNKGSEALSDAASKGADAASDAASKGADAASDAASKGADAASDATDKAGDKGDGSGKGGDASTATVDLGEFADDANAKTVGEFYKLRFEAASGAGDVSALKPVTTPERYEGVQAYVADAEGVTGPYSVTVVAVDGDSVDVCAGKNADQPRTATLVDGKVATSGKGDHTC
jgi:hypothetical protein